MDAARVQAARALPFPFTLTARTEAGLDAKPPTGECCAAAPPILEFDAEGKALEDIAPPLSSYDEQGNQLTKLPV